MRPGPQQSLTAKRLASLTLLLAAPLSLAGTAGCTAGQSAHEDAFHVWSLAEILGALGSGGNLATGSSVMPEGISPASIIEMRGAERALRVQPAFAEGKTAAYVTTDVWLRIPEVWLQPAYVLVENDAPNPTAVAGAPMLIDVSQRSLFYSPYWNIRLAVVGPLSNPNRYTSTRQLLDARPAVPILPGGYDNYPISPVDFLPAPEGTHLVDPTWGFDLDDITIHDTRYDGQVTRLLDLGSGTFHADASGLIEALPFFVFARRSQAGHLAPIGAARVAGVAPLFSGRPATMDTGPDTGIAQPVLGMFWSLVLVELPAAADVFHVEAHPAARDAIAAAGLDSRELEGRVATSAACFDLTSFPAGCAWLDSQAHIEGLGETALVPTDINVNSTFVSFDKRELDH